MPDRMEHYITESYRREWPAEEWSRLVLYLLRQGDDVHLLFDGCRTIPSWADR